jgi:hypothetical protein
MRGRTKEIHKELQDLDPLCSSHLEERWISGIIDLDLLSLFPQRYARMMGGIKRGAIFPRSTMLGERENKLLKEESSFMCSIALLLSVPQKGSFSTIDM